MDLSIANHIVAAKTAQKRLSDCLSKYDEFYFVIQEEDMDTVTALIEYLRLFATEDDPVAMIDFENGKPCGLTIFIHQKLLGTANHALMRDGIATFAMSSNAVFKTARKAKICINCIYGHEEPHCPYAGEITMFYSCDKWRLWQL